MRSGNKRILFSSGLCLLALASTPRDPQVSADDIQARAHKLHFSSIVVDTHADTTQRFIDGDFDLGPRNATGSVDTPRMKEGGLDAIFFSIWVPSKITGPIAVKHALDQIAAVREQVRKHPQDLVLATTTAHVREARKENNDRRCVARQRQDLSRCVERQQGAGDGLALQLSRAMRPS